jgi:Putative DNA-binding domain/MarR family
MIAGVGPVSLFDAAEILRLVAGGEGRQLELKEGVAADGRIARAICAFANTRGGLVLVGVSDRGRILGVPRPGSVIERLRELAARAIHPPVATRLEAVRVGAATVVCCSTPLSPSRPHAVESPAAAGRGEVLVRVGASNRAASAAAIAAMGTPESRRLAPGPLETRILRELGGVRGGVTVEEFAAATGVGKQRARQAFERLERAGLLIGHGLGARRIFGAPA